MASFIIHPVMKVAHRILASLVTTREKRSTISALELEILYVMAHPDDNLIPYYGSFLFNKLTHLRTSRSGKISFGGILFPDSFSKEEEEEDGDSDESGKAMPQNSPPMGGVGSSHQAGHPSYHQQYMDQFQ
ncbi:unnamed protein product [Lactuca saligna]|uniref:Uncharacterized protein n=1 Tax=Lactuca saligna TaxID=75948 RepID=A0AA35YMK0_LACSI|nr:unnamed protein product [Lactuca saligna]